MLSEIKATNPACFDNKTMIANCFISRLLNPRVWPYGAPLITVSVHENSNFLHAFYNKACKFNSQLNHDLVVDQYFPLLRFEVEPPPSLRAKLICLSVYLGRASNYYFHCSFPNLFRVYKQSPEQTILSLVETHE